MFCEVEGLKVNPSRRANLDLLSSDGHEESGGGEAKETSKVHQEQMRKGGWDERERVRYVYIHCVNSSRTGEEGESEALIIQTLYMLTKKCKGM